MRISSRQGEPGGVSGGGLWAAILAPALLLFFLNLAPQISGQTGSDPANRGKEAGEGYVGSRLGGLRVKLSIRRIAAG